MTTENLQAIYPAGASFTSEAWEVLPVFPGRPLRQGSLQVIWSGIDAGTGIIEVEVSNDNINWNCYADNTEVTIPAGSEAQMYEFEKFMTRYLRLRWTKNTVTAGTIIIRTHGAHW